MSIIVPLRVFAVALALSAFSAGCSSVRGAASAVNPFDNKETDDPDAPDKDKRISFLSFEQSLQVDPDAAAVSITLPGDYVNDEWPNEGGFATHVVQNVRADPNFQRVWRRDVGSGSSRKRRVASPPVAGAGKVFAVDASGEVNAYAIADGARIWSSRLKVKTRRDKEARSGGVAYGDGKVFLTSGHGFVAALDAETGDELWRTATSGPMHAPPTQSGGRVFAVSFDNELFAFDANSGSVLWTYQGLSEPARILTASTPAIAGDVIVAPFASGEIVALQVQNGRELWSEALTRTGRTAALASLNDIAGSPVIAGGVVYAISHSGVLAAFDLRTGQRGWAQPAGSIHMPWVAGNYLYILTNDAEVVCIERFTGSVIWIRALQQYRKEEKRRGRIAWAGPILVSDRLLVANSRGRMLSLSAKTGETLDELKIGDDVFIPPIVVQETIFVLTDDAKLIAYRG